jgi:DNA topoisomerase-2
LNGGHDSGSPRYIFTHLQPIVKILFNEHDNKLLEYLDDDGFSIEPKYYIPLIPMVLVNGSEGIGTGYSTNIPCYNPDDIVANLKKLIDTDGSGDLTPMTPWYRGFKGTITHENDHKYISTGVWTRTNPTTIEITELPIGKWTQVYKEFLESLIEANEIIDYKNNCDDRFVNFKIIMQKTVIDSLIEKDEIIKKLKLTSTVNTGNMHVFDEDCKIRKVTSPEEIIFRFYSVRKQHFVKRKEYLLETFNSELSILESKIKFIKLIIAEEIIVFNKKKDFIIKQINSHKLLMVNGSYDYLLDLKLWILTEEKIKELEDRFIVLKGEIDSLKKKSIKSIWTSELLSLDF